MELALLLNAEDGTLDSDATLYRRLIGSLIYTTNTRPNITYTMGIIARHMTNLKEIHWTTVVRVLKYLKITTKYGMLFERNKDSRLIAYSNLDFIGDKDTRRSTLGYRTFLRNSPISWRSKK